MRLRIAALFLLFCTAGAIAARHTPTLDEALSLQRLTNARISPDGRYVVYSVVETDWKNNEYVAHLWLVEVASGRRFQLTRGRKSSERPEWSPDGKWIAFVTEREPDMTTERESPREKEAAKPEDERSTGEKGAATDDKSDGKPAAKQVWLISPEGGEARQLTKSETDVDEFHWSKDGARIAFLANPAKSKAAKARKDKYGDFEVFEHDYEQHQLWMADVHASLEKDAPVRAEQLTNDPKLNVNDFNWSPDSSRIAFSATDNPLLAFSENSDVYLLDLKHAKAVHKLVALPGPDGHPVFSPDGGQLAFVSSLAAKYGFYMNRHIAVIDVAQAIAHPATRAADVDDVTAKFDEDPDLLDWGPDGIYFHGLQKTASHVFRVEPKTKAITRLTSPDSADVESVSFTRDFKNMALASATSDRISELYVSSLDSFAPRQLTHMNDQLADFTLGTNEIVSWKSGDGAMIEGVLHKPANFAPGKKYPLLVVIHGGPTGTSRALMNPADRTYPIQLFLAKGALVLEPNYRGSAGYGEAFRSLNVRNLGVGDMMDVMSGVDSLIAKGMVDPEKLGSMGWSQGGYISAFLTTHTARFKAISVGAGISDWTTYYVSTDITPFTRQYLQATPWDDPEIYARTSPITTIRQAKTPTLIQQGSNDKRVPVPDSFELYRGLQDQKVDSRLLLYTGYGHGITKPRSNRAVLQSNLDWFAHYIWGEPVPKDSPLNGSGEAGQ